MLPTFALPPYQYANNYAVDAGRKEAGPHPIPLFAYHATATCPIVCVPCLTDRNVVGQARLFRVRTMRPLLLLLLLLLLVLLLRHTAYPDLANPRFPHILWDRFNEVSPAGDMRGAKPVAYVHASGSVCDVQKTCPLGASWYFTLHDKQHRTRCYEGMRILSNACSFVRGGDADDLGDGIF